VDDGRVVEHVRKPWVAPVLAMSSVAAVTLTGADNTTDSPVDNGS
jgi:hypothetical protein